MRRIAIVGVVAIAGYFVYRQTTDAVKAKISGFNPVGEVLTAVENFFSDLFGNRTSVLSGSFKGTFDGKGKPVGGSVGGGFGGGGGAAF